MTLGSLRARATVASLLWSSTTMTRSTISWAITSCQVFSIVVSALYAGITTTTVFPAIIECEPWLGLGGLPLRVHAEYFSVTSGQAIQHEPSDGRRKVT